MKKNDKIDISIEKYWEMMSELEDAIIHYEYSRAREMVLLAPDITVDGNVPAVTFDMIMDYALCLTSDKEFEKAIKLVGASKKFLYMEHVMRNAYIPSKESLMKMWKKICRIYASCPGTSSLLRDAISSMSEQKVELDVKSYMNIAKLCRRSGNYEMALKFLEMALKLAQKIKNAELEATINKEIEKNSIMMQKLAGSEFVSFVKNGGQLKPGMIIGVSNKNIPKEKNPLLPENMPEMLTFLIWKVTPEHVYAFQMRIAKKRDLAFCEPIEIDEDIKVLNSSAIYRLPIVQETIVNVQQTLDDKTLERVLKNMYQLIAKSHTNPKGAQGGENGKHFVNEMTKQCIATPGDRLIIGKSYYYVESVDTDNKEYIVVPTNYSCEIDTLLRFRIPFKHSSIFAIVDTSEEERKKIKQSLPEGFESNYINTFCQYGKQTYLITGEDDNGYICLNVCVQLSNGSQETIYIPKGSFNLHATCMGINLADCFSRFHKLITQSRGPKKFKSE